ncbi:oligoendopeptidase F [Metabacillus arenae]|uniref:Oligopeptidase F n=1 Tax=Metabacillus arenae TaxID=2771434 RepID=A0A926RYM3_9BACI|nr:oligoendopeptidase F [Metabacillus arenae]MBD1382231.1 oligoendopeptidase F [Metabacillus arenae]
MTQYQSRDDVPLNEKWNLQDIYSSIDEWNEDYRAAEKLNTELKTFDGNIKNGEELYDYLYRSEELTSRFHKLSVYAMLQIDEDTRVSSSQVLQNRVTQLGVKITAARSFFHPFLLSLQEETLEGYIKEVKELEYFERDLLESYRYRDHVLSKEQEEVISQFGEALSSPGKTFGLLNNADIKFGKVTNEDGSKIELTRGMYSKLLEDKDRTKRKEAFKSYFLPYVQLKNTIASTLTSAVKNNATTSKLRNYSSSLEKALFPDLVPKAVYENLIQTARDHLHPLHQYMTIRKNALGLEKLRQYDLRVPLLSEARQTISFDDAYMLMLKGLAPLGEEYVSRLKEIKDKRYIDIRETPGKRSGAYNCGLYGIHPFVLLNHQDDLNSLFTLVHEMGHCMHSLYSSENQPRISAGYSIFVAEVASTVNEVLLIHYLLKHTDQESIRKQLLNQYIDQFRGIFFTQVMFAEFEKWMHEMIEGGESLTAESLCQKYKNLYQAYNGTELTLDEEVQYAWAQIPHFYRPFYVYKYATGYISAIYIADRLLQDDQEMLTNYLEFLKSGSSDYPLALLKKAGVDLEKPEPFEKALGTFAEIVDEFEEAVLN